MTIDVSIIIPVGSDMAGLETTLHSIREKHRDSTGIEVIVCNDGGGDRISEIAARFGCIEARLEENQGSYAARNAGLRIARGCALVFIDADQTVTQDWLKRGLAALNHADYVGGRVLIDTCPDSPFWERVDASSAFPVESYLARLKFAPTANLFVTREVFRRLGGFNESLRSGGDREFGVRVARAKFIQGYAEDAVTIHPPRGLREQLRKSARTASGSAQLEIMLWRQSTSRLLAKALFLAPARLLRSLRFCALHVFSHKDSRQGDAYLLAGGRAMIECNYYTILAASAAALVLRRQQLQDRIPDLA